MLRCRKYNLIRNMRKHRDELLNCDNQGRAETLLLGFKDVCSIQLSEGSFGISRIITVVMMDGSRFNMSGYGEYLQGIKNMGEFLYQRWLKSL